jgi:hypothetical protein
VFALNGLRAGGVAGVMNALPAASAGVAPASATPNTSAAVILVKLIMVLSIVVVASGNRLRRKWDTDAV